MKLDWLWIVFVIVCLLLLGCPEKSSIDFPLHVSPRETDTTQKKDTICLPKNGCYPDLEPPDPPKEMK